MGSRKQFTPDFKREAPRFEAVKIPFTRKGEVICSVGLPSWGRIKPMEWRTDLRFRA